MHFAHNKRDIEDVATAKDHTTSFFSGHRKPTRAIRLYKNTASALINKALMVGVNCVEFIFIPIINVSPPNT